jgi:hypothetical protein
LGNSSDCHLLVIFVFLLAAVADSPSELRQREGKN